MKDCSRASTVTAPTSSLPSTQDQESPLVYTSEDLGEDEELGWLWEPHTDFSHHLFLAIRVAAGTALVLLPLLVREHTSGVVDLLRHRGLIMRSDIAMYLYTVYVSTGSTIELAWSALVGTFLSVGNMWVMQGFFPGGRHEDSVWWAFPVMVGDGAIFTFLVLYLDLAMNTRIFALSSFVWHIMTFINPNEDSNFSAKFSLDFAGADFREFKAASIGCMLAILTTMIPWPFWAHKHAVSTAERLVNVLDHTWQECSRLMCSSEVDHYTQDTVMQRLKSLQSDLHILSGDIEDSWWEQFKRPRLRNRRKMLSRLASALTTSYDDIRNVWSNCLNEEFGDIHSRFMELIQRDVNRVIGEAGSLLKEATRAACLGHVDNSCAENLMRRHRRTREATTALTMGFLDAKKTLQQKVISTELIDEHCFCLNLCTYGRVVCEFAEALVEHSRGSKPLPGPRKTSICVMGTGDWNFTLRNFITIALGMFVGYHGYYNRFRDYDAGIASTLAILLSKYSGSALAKNLQRIQGVVIGTVFGQLVYALLAWCSWWGYLSLMVFNFIWISVTYFVYFHIPGYSTIACLMGVFGTTNMIGAPLNHVGCSSDVVTKENLAESYYDIVNVCTALFLGSAVDLLLGKSAKVMACEAAEDIWQDLRQAIENILDPSDPATRVHSGEISGKIAHARSLGAEAAQELSLRSSPWRTNDFNHTMDAAQNLRIFLDSLESTAAQGIGGGDKDQDFLQATKLKSFHAIRQKLLQDMDVVQDLLQNLQPTKNNLGPGKKKVLHRLSSLNPIKEGVDLETFLEEASFVSWEATADFSLENDGPAQVCVLIAGVQAMQVEVRALHRCLKPTDDTFL